VSGCGCCTGTIGACTEGCCCAACNPTPAPGGRTQELREEIIVQVIDGEIADAVLALPVRRTLDADLDGEP
jgi:hypothetical protein